MSGACDCVTAAKNLHLHFCVCVYTSHLPIPICYLSVMYHMLSCLVICLFVCLSILTSCLPVYLFIGLSVHLSLCSHCSVHIHSNCCYFFHQCYHIYMYPVVYLAQAVTDKVLLICIYCI